jgi:hypothetical protein
LELNPGHRVGHYFADDTVYNFIMCLLGLATAALCIDMLADSEDFVLMPLECYLARR